jgi:dynein heavy chain 2
MIPSQQPMMLDLAKNFERLVKDPKVSRKNFIFFYSLINRSFSKERGGAGDSGVKITWDNPEQLSRYIATLRAAAEKIKTENLKLRRHHSTIQQIICSLMNTDLLREGQKWNEQIQDMRKIMENLISEGYSSESMKSWRSFWNRQLYKALDLQYSIGLKAFNENLPDINIDLLFG